MATSITKKKGRASTGARFTPHPSRTGRVKNSSSIMKLADDLLAIGMRVPAEERAKLPRDFNENLDHYLYGAPRKKPRRS